MKAHKLSRTGGSAKAARHYQTKPAKRILVVEDEPDIRLLDTEVLRESGYQVDTVTDGLFALQTLETDRYDLLIVEEEMSPVTGLELVKALCSEKVMIPAILVLGTIQAKELNPNRWPQVQAILFKPYTVAELVRTVKQVLRPTGTAAHSQFASPLNWQSPVCSRWVSALKM
jgi:DNA-binding response OmpR family regulator